MYLHGREFYFFIALLNILSIKVLVEHEKRNTKDAKSEQEPDLKSMDFKMVYYLLLDCK